MRLGSARVERGRCNDAPQECKGAVRRSDGAVHRCSDAARRRNDEARLLKEYLMQVAAGLADEERDGVGENGGDHGEAFADGFRGAGQIDD